MATTSLGRRLTEDHRLRQLAIRSAFLRDLLRLFGLLDPARLDRTTEPWLTAAVPLVTQARARSADASTTYFAKFWQAETGTPTTIEPESPRLTAAQRQAITTSLLVTGPVEIKRRSAAGEGPEKAKEAATVTVSGAASRHVLNGGRAVLLDTADKQATAARKPFGWARVTDGDPCWWCAMQASRGYVFRSRASAGEGRERSKRTGELFKGDGQAKFHDHCGCTIEPSFTLNATVPGRGPEFEALWKASTKGLSGRNTRLAFRRALEGRPIEGDPILTSDWSWPPKS